MEDWVQLTAEDIKRATQLTQMASPTPDVLTLTMDDISNETTSMSEDSEILAITVDDLGPATSQAPATPDIERLEQLMFHLINATRQHHLPSWVGTAQLVWHPELVAASRQHSIDMLRRQYVAHVTPEGLTAAQRLQRHGISYVACGENIGIVYGEAARSERAVHEIHNAFIRQPRSLTNHRGNLLNPIWTHVGVGIAYNPEGALVATQNFISAPGRRLRDRSE